MDIASDLRANMARHDVDVAYVAGLLGRSRKQVSAYRTGDAPLSLEQAQLLNSHDPQLVSDEALLGRTVAA